MLKALYESLIDPAQRHDLGEYYTPDWLAAKLTRVALADPLRQQVLDPACGSGTFLFHAVRRLLAAAEAAGWTQRRAVEACGSAGARAGYPSGCDHHRARHLAARAGAGPARPAGGTARAGVSGRRPAMEPPGTERDEGRCAVTCPDEPPLHLPAGFAEDPDEVRLRPAGILPRGSTTTSRRKRSDAMLAAHRGRGGGRRTRDDRALYEAARARDGGPRRHLAVHPA